MTADFSLYGQILCSSRCKEFASCWCGCFVVIMFMLLCLPLHGGRSVWWDFVLVTELELYNSMRSTSSQPYWPCWYSCLLVTSYVDSAWNYILTEYLQSIKTH